VRPSRGSAVRLAIRCPSAEPSRIVLAVDYRPADTEDRVQATYQRLVGE